MRVEMAKKNKDQSVDKDSYHQAYDEWSARIGSAKTQARNWRFACLLCLLVLVLLLVAFTMLLSSQKSYVYVAEVKPQESVVNVRAMDQAYSPSQAQEEYFINQFIHNIMTLPLDPVVVRENWLNAYGAVQGKAKYQLNTYARAHNPFSVVGKQTSTVEIQKFNPISNNSYEFNWLVTIYNNNGKVVSKTLYNGIFTVVGGVKPTTQKQLLNNPLGLRIEYFSFSSEVGK